MGNRFLVGRLLKSYDLPNILLLMKIKTLKFGELQVPDFCFSELLLSAKNEKA